jgi:GNAT superfamily N-acetyltransferase
LGINNSKLTPVISDLEIARVATLATTIWKQHYTPIIGKEQVDYMLNQFQSAETITSQIAEGSDYFLLQSENDLGYLSIKAEEHTLFLSKIYLLQNERGKGLGKKMMNFVTNKAHEMRLNSIRLTVNKYNHDAIASYEKMGFTKKREVVFDIGNGYIMDDYEMVLEL